MATSVTQEGAESFFRDVFVEVVRTTIFDAGPQLNDILIAQLAENANEEFPLKISLNRPTIKKARDTIRAHFMRVWDETADKDVLESHARTLWRVLFDAVKGLPFQWTSDYYYTYNHHLTMAKVVSELARLGTLRRSEASQANDANPDVPTTAVLRNGQFMFGDVPYFQDDLRYAFKRVIDEQAPSEHWANLHLFTMYLAGDTSGSLQESSPEYALIALREALERDHENSSENPGDPSAAWRVRHLSFKQLLEPAVLWIESMPLYLRKATIEPNDVGGRRYIDTRHEGLSSMGELAIRANVVNCLPRSNVEDMRARGRWYFWKARLDAIHKSIPENAQGEAMETRMIALHGYEVMVNTDAMEKELAKSNRCCTIL